MGGRCPSAHTGVDEGAGFRPAGRVPFCPGRKEPKRRKRWAQREKTGCAAPVPMTPTPGPPFYGGSQLGTLAVNAKARVAQLTGFRSITAAAERLVTFGCFFYRWKARLWVRWGSSCATGDGGRLIAAPTAENGPGRWFGNGRRRSGTAATSIFFPLRPPVGPDGTAPKHS